VYYALHSWGLAPTPALLVPTDYCEFVLPAFSLVELE